ncbi:unnamed protein product [Sphenostylis stenocarpa]|uniref:Uncharacterized protein n=1 Tax=Sphenostylis stenocarpa TaxID=92480 RepID=A0AA86SK78_9FABA|nr:unnamed protein product [Sphenostylis stenocarpa]
MRKWKIEQSFCLHLDVEDKNLDKTNKRLKTKSFQQRHHLPFFTTQLKLDAYIDYIICKNIDDLDGGVVHGRPLVGNHAADHIIELIGNRIVDPTTIVSSPSLW